MLQNLKDLVMNNVSFSPTYDEFYHWVTLGYQNENKIERTKERIVQTNEIFTSLEIVLYGLEIAYPPEFFLDYSISFSDNCVGEGVWLVGMVLKRMQAGLPHEQAIQNLKGVDIMHDNVEACKRRLLCKREDLRHIVEKNIVCADALTYNYTFGEKETFGNGLFEME